MHKVTHLSGHPSILTTIIEEAKHRNSYLPHKVYAHIAGVLPPYDDYTFTAIQNLGFEVVHRYEMTEILGPPVINKLWNTNCCSNNIMDHIMEEFDVKNSNTMESVPCDGKTVGEVSLREIL